jgi:endonuclease/exonuclease/phosphatase family metal-dependent hydrolase
VQKRYWLFVLALYLQLAIASAQVKLCSWNIQNFGKSKPDSSITFMAKQLREFDVVAVLEVSTGEGGAQAVARLADALNRTGTKWDYVISDPTQSSPGRSERYAFLWKPSRLKKIGDAWLEKKYAQQIEREPFFMSFEQMGKRFTVAAFHALPKKHQPETEIKYFQFLPAEYPSQTILFCGDFNCPQSHNVFNPLRQQGFVPALVGQKTTLKTKCVDGNCLASEYDNVFFDVKKVDCVSAGAIQFYKSFKDVLAARRVSDHLPVYVEFRVK